MNPLPRSYTALARSFKSIQTPQFTLRAFSSSNGLQRGTLPKFNDPSSPELSTLLSNLNSKILLPHHLTPDQSRLVYRQSNRARLEADPLWITLGDVELPLEHIDTTKDIPARWTTIKQVVELSRTPQDWENVLLMIEGFYGAGIKLRSEWKCMVLRNMFEAGRADMVVRCLERVERTGVSLKDEEVRAKVFMGLRACASDAKWGKDETTWALKSMERVVELMEHRLHLGKWVARPGDARADPVLIGFPLEVAGMRVKKHVAGKDDGSVLTYATRTMAAFAQDDYMRKTLPTLLTQKLSYHAPEKPNAEKAAIADLRRGIYGFIPVWNALRTATEVLGPNMPMADDAKRITSEIWKGIQGARKILEEKNVVGGVDEMVERCRV